jgi:hypothetical protein
MEVKIRKVTMMPTSDPARRGEVNTWVIYEVDGKRTETITIPKDKPTEAEILAAITAAEKARTTITGKTFTIK